MSGAYAVLRGSNAYKPVFARIASGGSSSKRYFREVTDPLIASTVSNDHSQI